ncbi:MAG: hypothetical protein ACOC8I_04390 [Desulfosalsimonas sp.]
MSRKNGSVLDEFVKLPWWLSVILSVVVYLSFTYLLPLVAFQHFFFKGIAEMMTGLVPALAGILLLVSGVSLFNAWRKRELLERQKGTGTLQSVGWKDFEDLVGEAYRRKGYSVYLDTRGSAVFILGNPGSDLLQQERQKQLQ